MNHTEAAMDKSTFFSLKIIKIYSIKSWIEFESGNSKKNIFSYNFESDIELLGTAPTIFRLKIFFSTLLLCFY